MNPLLSLIESHIGKSLQPSPDSHLPLDLHLQRFMVPGKNNQPLYHLERDTLLALNLAGLNLKDSQLEFLNHLGFSSLQALNLSKNSFTQTDFFGHLKQLRYLDLNGTTQLKRLYFPKPLKQLKRLDLTNASVEIFECSEGLPDLEILHAQGASLTKLHLAAGYEKLFFLDLKGNKLKSFLVEGEMPALHTLYMEANQLKEIHKDFLAPFPNLVRLRLEGNPLHESIMANIEENSTKTLAAVKRYVEDLQGGSERDLETKVLLLGNGNVGKSCLVRRLVYNEFLSEWNSTHGISLEQYPKDRYNPETENKVAPYLLNLWDFGGQDLYHATHRLFMQANAVYLLLWDWETENKEKTLTVEAGKERTHINHSMQYWLDYAKSQGKGSPIIVVQTKVERDGKKEIPGIREQFAEKISYLEFEHIDSKPDNWQINGYNRLLHEIQGAISEFKKEAKLPSSWVSIRQQIRELQQRKKKRLELPDFYQLAEKVQDPMDVLNWLTQSGVVFYKEGLFNDEIILDQGWAIEAIYTLFDRKKFYYKAFEGQKGRFSGGDLTQIWEKNSEAERELFLSFMLSCELCFETTPKDEKKYHTPFSERTFIAPQLLPQKATQREELFWEGKDAVYIRFEYEFLHYGIIQSFIVRTSHLANTEDIWRTGILLTEEEQIVQVEAQEKRIEVKAKPNSLDLLEKIRKELNEIQGSEIPAFVSTDGKSFVSMGELKKQAIIGNSNVECLDGGIAPIEGFSLFLGKDKELHSIKVKEQDSLKTEDSIPRSTLPKGRVLGEKTKPRVYFSYAWGDPDEEGSQNSREDIVNALYNALEKEQKNYELLRDKMNLAYGDLISDFIEDLAKGDLVIVFISDKYFRSAYCMNELYEIARINQFDKKKFIERVLPVKVEKLNLKDVMVLTEYWDAEREKWANFVKKRIDKHNFSEAHGDRLILVQKIAREFGDLTSWLSDIHASSIKLLSQNDYQLVKETIEKRLYN